MSNSYYLSDKTTSAADPWSQHSDWVTNAIAVRRELLSMMGLPESEIDEMCEHSPPTNLDEEFAHYNAMFAVQDRNDKFGNP